MQKTFMMIKPDGIENKDEIMKILKENGLKIEKTREINVERVEN